MKIALYGASGMIGQRILAEALNRGHEVTAIVRTPSKVTAQSPNLNVIAGDVLDPVGVATAVAGHDAVISAYSPPHENVGVLVEAYRLLTKGVANAGVKRLITVGGAGSLEVAPGVDLIDSGFLPAEWLGIAVAHRDALAVQRAESGDLDWTNASPAAFIQPGERIGKFRLGTDQLISGEDGQSRISAEDFAVAILDELEKPQYIKQRFTAAY